MATHCLGRTQVIERHHFKEYHGYMRTASVNNRYRFGMWNNGAKGVHFWAVLTISCALIAGCDDPKSQVENNEPNPDGGASVDGGALVDGGAEVDVGAAVDGGAELDGGGEADGGAEADLVRKQTLV